MRNSLAKSLCLILLLILFMVSLTKAQETDEETLSSIYQINQQNCGFYSSYGRRSINHNRLLPKEVELISSGQDVQEGMFPSYVHLDLKVGSCGGVLITDRHILTAAHCVQMEWLRADAYTGIEGRNSYLSQRYPVERACPSRKFSPVQRMRDASFDVAVLKLAQPVSNARPACLPDLEVSYDEPAWAVGLGKSSEFSNPSILQRLNVKRDRCLFFDLHSTKICFKATHAQGTVCEGDSGGPVYAIFNGKQTVVGLTSYGHVRECEPRDHTAVFANVYNLREEIENLYSECR